ncbi:hypothetical protein CBL_09384 [Carabus blaptoides fortunei]
MGHDQTVPEYSIHKPHHQMRGTGPFTREQVSTRPGQFNNLYPSAYPSYHMYSNHGIPYSPVAISSLISYVTPSIPLTAVPILSSSNGGWNTELRTFTDAEIS